MSLGSAVHELLLQPESFQLAPKLGKPNAKLGDFTDKVLYYRRKGESIYDAIEKASNSVDYYKGSIFKQLHNIKNLKDALAYYIKRMNYPEQEGDIFLNDYDYEIVLKILDSYERNIRIQRLLHPKNEHKVPLPSFNEDALFIDYAVLYGNKYGTTLKFKLKIDNWFYDLSENEVVLNDVKTSSGYIKGFMEKDEHFEKYHYARQMAAYKMALEQFFKENFEWNELWKVKVNMLVFGTKGMCYSQDFSVNQELLEQGQLEFEQLMKRVAYYQIFGYDEEVKFV